MRRGSPPVSTSARRRLGAALAALALALVPAAAGCGSDADEADPVAAPVELTVVKVGLIPIVDVAPLYLGRERGIFAKHGIDLQIQLADNGPAIVKGVVEEAYNFGFANMTSLLINHAKKVPLQVVASGVASTGDQGLDFGAIVVPVDSAIKDARDLAGKTIAVNAPGSIGDTTIRASVRKAGGDPTKLKFVQVPLPRMQADMEAGKADAAWVVEPWLSLTKGTGGRVIAWNYVDLAKGLTVAAYFTHTKFAQQSPAVVQKFVTAAKESMRYATDHPDQVRDILETYTTIDRVLAQMMTLPDWPEEINRASVEALATNGEADGLFKGLKPDPDKLLPQT